jgi:hypothetical protein
MAIGLMRILGPAPSGRRRVGWIALVAAVIIAHGCVTSEIADHIGDIREDSTMPKRMEVTYVHELALTAPPPSAAPAAPPEPEPTAAPRRVVKRRPPSPAKAASAPEVKAEPAPEPPVAAVSEPEPAASQPKVEVAAASAPPIAAAPANPPSTSVAAAASPAASAASSPVFEWPNSTRVSYVLTGNYRGEVNGSAQVEWLRSGDHYQVHLDLVVGPSMAPVITRQMTSDGSITADGLSPQRYDQDTKVVMRDRTRVTITFEPGIVVLANGTRRPSVQGVQDTASQFVQLTYVFSTKPELLRIGGSVDIPLALPHKVDVWTYDVVNEETLNTSFGPLPAIHLKPRRRPDQNANSLSAEMWFAPQLRYLPARIRIEQDAQNYIDLMIAKLPDTTQ